jgi:hypothetical protein
MFLVKTLLVLLFNYLFYHIDLTHSGIVIKKAFHREMNF